jgi:hypothetical protein
MKSWTSAILPGRCAYDGSHTWMAGARIYVVQGPSGWRKLYCNGCGLSRHQAPPDTGEILDLEDQPTYPKPLLALADQVRQQFDARAAAARNDE